MASPNKSALSAAASAQPSRSCGLAAAWFVLGALLVSNAPLHVSMPLASDTVLYDLQARNLIAGGVLYRDVFETNLPGIVWLHAALRSVIGWSSEAIRLVDLAIVAGLVWLLARFVRRQGVSPAGQVTAAAVLCWCYLSVSEWCHCQRDTWMLLPALGAFFLRLRQGERLVHVSHQPHQPGAPARDASAGKVFAWAFAEGLLWAVAFWIKPFVAVPALTCFLVTGAQAVAAGGIGNPSCGRRIASDAAGLLCGGLLAGAAGIVWLGATGAWPHFLETFLEWNPDYVAGGRSRWTFERMYGIGYRLFPWILIHIAAVPVAVAAVGRGIRHAGLPFPCGPATTDRTHHTDGRGGRRPVALFAALYLAWLGQSVAVQQPFDYIQVPPILLGLTLLAAAWPAAGGRPAARLAIAAFVLLAAISSPTLKRDRLAGWWDSATQGSTPQVRDRLAYLRTPDYGELEHVAEFLRSQQVRDGDVTCYHVHLIHLYPQLGIRPSTRYIGVEALRRLFPQHCTLIDETVAGCGHRFVVTDLVEAGLSVSEASAVGPNGRLQLPPAVPAARRREFPWILPVVFRANRYLVHAVSGAVPPEADRTAATN